MSSSLPGNLRANTPFPDFIDCPSEYDIGYHNHYDLVNGGNLQPNHHWCLLAQIEEVERFFRLRLIVRDRGGHRFVVAFYLENDPRGSTFRCRYVHGTCRNPFLLSGREEMTDHDVAEIFPSQASVTQSPYSTPTNTPSWTEPTVSVSKTPLK